MHFHTLYTEVPSSVLQVLVNFTARSVYLQWTAPNFTGNSDILGYKVYQRAVDTQTTLHFVQTSPSSPYTTTMTMFNITSGVLPYTKYELAVEACNMIGCGTRTGPATVRTNPAGE